MDIISGDLQNLEIHEELFKNIKFFISGQTPEKIIDLLKTGGAERMNYFSDYVTHLIVGTNPEENDITDANDLYEIPAITPKWIIICVKLKRLVSTKPYLYNTQKLFTNFTFCLSKVGDDLNLLWALITHNGGRVLLRLTPKCTHLVTTDTKTQKYEKAMSLGSDRMTIVTPDWIIEAVKNKSMPDANLFHPKLIQWTKAIKHESTTASITGFEPDSADSSAKIEEENVADSTNALLEKLKQRMAFNRPQADIISPPNVVAPSFLNKTHAANQMNQVRAQVPMPQQQQQQQPQNPPIYNNQMQPAQQIPRSIVHHTPQNTFQTQQPQLQQQQTQQHQQQPNLGGRLVNQQPMIRAQLNNQQLQQQLLQQRINQQRVNPQLMQRQQLLQNPNNQPQLMNQNQMVVQGNQDLTKNQQILQIQQQQIQVKQQMQLNPNCQQLLQNSPKQGFQQQQILVAQQQKQLFSPTSSPQTNQQFVSPPFQSELNQVAPQQILQQQQNVQHQLLPPQQPQLNQQTQLLNPQQQPQIKQPFVQQTAINQQLIQQQQLLQPMDQQPTTLNQFQQQPNVINPQQQQQQVLLNQQTPRPQLNQHLWQQQPPQQQIVNVVQQQPGARLQWSPTQQPAPQQAQQGGIIPQRQFIHLDQQTHNQLQKMPPEQRALFVAKLQKQRLVRQVQQRGGSHILIRGAVPAGLSTQQQVQWLQQQARQQGIVLPPNIQQQNITPGTLTTQNPNAVQNVQQSGQQQQQTQHGAPGLSPIQQNPGQFSEQNQQQQLQMRQYRLQQLQLQREQVQKTHMVQQQQTQQAVQAPQQQGAVPPPNILRPIGQPPVADPSTAPPPPPQPLQDNQVQHSLVVNAKTKTALANMLSIKLQSGGSTMGPRPDAIQEPSAAGTLRLLTAHHHANLNTNARPQDIAMAIQHRRVINGPNGEIIRAPGAPVVPVQPQNEPPKLQYGQRPAVPLQHRPGPFYGHNPNLKLPPDLFLLGCIFVVVEIEKYLDEAIPDWQKRIEKHGGEVEKQYCTRVTHVLCETQRHGVVMQALRDSKRCVTIYWLSDVMKSKHVLPPWAALHLPTIYLDIAPASKHLMSLSGFEGSERTKIKHMIKYTGAKFTPYFSKHNTILIAARNDGNKCTYAKKWGIPVVNVQWLTDVMLGHFPALNQTENQLYQQFIQPTNFNFDPKLVPNLMHSWKMPINISQDSYERVKRSASPIVLPKKIKKPKVEQTDENDNINEEMTTTHRILFSMFTNVDEMKKMVKDLNGSVAKSYQDCTHLVMPYLARSNKLLYCLCRGDVHIVPEKWLTDSHTSNQFLPESNYVLDTKDFNSEYRCDFAQTLATKGKNRLFEGRYFWITPSVYPNKKFLTELVHLCGGVVEKCRRSASQIEATNLNSPYSYIILTQENDLHLVADLLKNKKDKNRIICSVELVFSAILKQTFEVESFAVKFL